MTSIGWKAGNQKDDYTIASLYIFSGLISRKP